ncbi:alpha-L-fucosidase [Alkalihalobacillus oceani]|uniref:alpha-L-fucosidase n=1 Tax=Halalkalibacter oceani TaxID=1653776 RepID=A0A9X2DMF2_9BACI|nr:alpha-L-fucosidase [Halalkalibacter oceani]MCM3712968.1 alpha-L-fucosidase [Halalkalibacter oceani]
MISKFHDRRDVFFERKFGMFIHWGLYAIPAWQEQILWRTKMPRSEYEQLITQFNPIHFNPDEWLDAVEMAGMNYICFTTKHHDGFCMWDTKYTDYKVTNTPYGKDILAMLAEACQRRGIALSLYYSCPDWHHPNYPNQGRHHEMFGPRDGDKPDINNYYQFVRNQIQELCTEYGEIYQFFWDINVAEFHDPSINEMIRSLQPGILINDRGPSQGDYNTPERHVPATKAFTRPTEANQALGRESWGYKEDEDYYSNKFIMQSIDQILAMGGNYLLNVGPKADGTIAEENIQSLKAIGNWYRSVKESFDDTYPASYLVDEDVIKMEGNDNVVVRDEVLVTRKENTLYVHLFKDPQSSAIILKPLDIMPEKAILLNNQQELEARVDLTPWHWKEKPYLRIRGLPVNQLTDSVMVIKLEFSQSLNE